MIKPVEDMINGVPLSGWTDEEIEAKLTRWNDFEDFSEPGRKAGEDDEVSLKKGRKHTQT